MNVFVTFDVEVWCNGWGDLDGSFPSSFERYVYGRSESGNYALPKTLAILNRNALKGVFFVEPLFASRFGVKHLKLIVQLIRDAGHEIGLHLHPEWTDEAHVPIILNCSTKRQHLSYYTLDEQTELIAYGKHLLEAAGSGPVKAFRSGSFAVNRDTFEALARNDIWLDSSLNRCYDVSAPDLLAEHIRETAFSIGEVTTYPVTILRDGFGRDRPAHVSACGLSEMRDGLQSAQAAGIGEFVIVSHNFELLRVQSSEPDWVVVRRYEGLCQFLRQNDDRFHVRGFGDDLRITAGSRKQTGAPQAGFLSTSARHLEQIRRRLY